MAFIPVPINTDFDTWSNQLTISLPDYDIPTANGIKKWREWALNIITYNNLGNVPTPTLLFYPEDEDWRKWAIQFMVSINA